MIPAQQCYSSNWEGELLYCVAGHTPVSRIMSTAQLSLMMFHWTDQKNEHLNRQQHHKNNRNPQWEIFNRGALWVSFGQRLDFKQAPNPKRSVFLCLPGHRVLQVLFCTDMPSQKAPPLRGVGFVQVRERFCTPRPQRTLQGDQSVHDDQPPFTECAGGMLAEYKGH